MAEIETLRAINLDRAVTIAERVRVANTAVARLVGLLRTPEADFQPGAGLWILPCDGIHMMGMKYAIDALYLDRDLRVLHVVRAIKPWRVGRVMLRSQSVLELPAGTIASTGTQVGDQLEIA